MKNIITFYSADSKVGTTMLCQTVAEMLAKLRPDKKVMVAHLDGNPGTEYTGKHQYCLDDIRLQLISDVLTMDDFLAICVKNDNLYSMAGCKNILVRKYYEPAQVEKLFVLMRDYFDIIIVDAGCSDRGLTIGSLLHSDANILVTTQQKTAHEKFLKMSEQVFRELSISFDQMIINKFSYSVGTFLPTEKEVASLYSLEDAKCVKVEMSNYAWQSEYEKIPLTEYKEKNVLQGLTELVSNILGMTEDVNTNMCQSKVKKKSIFRRKEQLNAVG